VDWEAVEPLFRAGVRSIREIAKQFCITESAIRQHAKKYGWTRELSDRVRKEVREKLLRSEAAQNAAQVSDAQVVEAASLAGFQVVQSHRTDINRLRQLAADMITDLTECREKYDKIEEAICEDTKDDVTLARRSMMRKAVSLHSRSGILLNLSTAISKMVTLERIAWNLNDTAPSENPLEAILGLVDGARWSPDAA
jgi:predicted transcriptional regulator